MCAGDKKTLGQAIDAILEALLPLDEPTRATAIRAACEHLGVPQAAPIGAAAPPPSDGAQTAATRPGPPASNSPLHDIRWLREQTQPSSVTRMACVVAYYLGALAPADERKSTVTAADMRRYFKEAGYPLPKRPPQMLPNAKARGFFDPSGYRTYRLNSAGHELVARALPRPH